MTRMLLLQTIIATCSLIPMAINSMWVERKKMRFIYDCLLREWLCICLLYRYAPLTSAVVKNPLRLTIERLVSVISFHLLMVLPFSSKQTFNECIVSSRMILFLFEAFYLYMIGSKEVRAKLNNFFCSFKQTANRIEPLGITMQSLRTAGTVMPTQPDPIWKGILDQCHWNFFALSLFLYLFKQIIWTWPWILDFFLSWFWYRSLPYLSVRRISICVH